MGENEIGRIVIDSAIRVHRALGHGLLESVYEIILLHEIRQRGLMAERQVSVPIVYCGHRFDEGFRADIVVEAKVILELKCVKSINAAHKKQLLTYLRLAGVRLGYLFCELGALCEKFLILDSAYASPANSSRIRALQPRPRRD